MTIRSVSSLACLVLFVLTMPAQSDDQTDAREVSALVNDLKNGDPRTRMTAAMALGNRGAGAGTVLDHVDDAAKSDSDPRVRRWAKQAARKIRQAVAEQSELDQPEVKRRFPVKPNLGGTLWTIGSTSILSYSLDGERATHGVATDRLVILNGLLAVNLRNNYVPRIGTGLKSSRQAEVWLGDSNTSICPISRRTGLANPL